MYWECSVGAGTGEDPHGEMVSLITGMINRLQVEASCLRSLLDDRLDRAQTEVDDACHAKSNAAHNVAVPRHPQRTRWHKAEFTAASRAERVEHMILHLRKTLKQHT